MGGQAKLVARVDFERPAVQFLQVVRNGVYLLNRAVVELDAVHHLLVPQADFLQIRHEVVVDDGELPGHVRFHVEVRVQRFDGGRRPVDGGNGRRRRDGHRVRVPHPVFCDVLADDVPVERLLAVGRNFAVALRFQRVDGVLREQSPVPLRPLVGRVAPRSAASFEELWMAW